MARAAAYLIAVLAAVAVVGALADFSTRTAACMACHTREASFADWMAARLKAENKGFSHELISCASCHIKGAAEGTIASRFRGMLHAIEYLVPQIDPRRPRVSAMVKRWTLPTENCRFCHLGAVTRKSVQLRDLPPELKKIGLTMDHRKHVLARDDTCARCHERYKEKNGGAADKGVNYSEVNHLGCDSCHTFASHSFKAGRMLPLSEKEYVQAREDAWKRLATNPRWMVSVPSEQTCRRCHDGKIHFKTRIFQANCQEGTNFDDCAKCHPLMTRQYFDQYRRDRGKLTSSGADKASDG